MPEHLNQLQLEGYRDRTLALGEQVAVRTLPAAGIAGTRLLLWQSEVLLNQ
jgi:hypothetical protein